ncbi:MAG: hypothetical protein JW909_12870 [Planctomycetes bacterium]|nr:hypothetical protein [Planctomycetota bacterium]
MQKTIIPGVHAFAEGPYVRPYLHSGVAETYRLGAAALAVRTPVVAVEGPAGSGKSTLATAIAGMAEGVPLMDLSAFSASLIDCAAALLGGKREALPRLMDNMAGEEVLFLVDGPGLQTCERAAEEILLLLQLVGKPASFVIAGNADAIGRITRHDGIAVRQPVVVRTEMMRVEETGGYLAHRLAEAGIQSEVFNVEAATFMGAAAGGCPAAVNAIARKALAAAHMAGTRYVGLAEAEAAAGQVQQEGSAYDD